MKPSSQLRNIILLALFVCCFSQSLWAAAAVTGTVTYPQRLALPPDAVLQVQLLDVSRQDAPAKLLGQQVITNPGQVPIPFRLDYDSAAIDPRYTYTVQARITAGGRLLFISTSAHLVITRGHPNHVEVVLQQVCGKSSP